MTANTMAALAKLKPETGIWADRAPIPETGPDDVLIRVKRTAICGTDIHIYNWDSWAARTIPVPMIVGHEFGGEIVEIGSRVTRPLKVGQRVSGEGHLIDFNSAAARAGRFHLDPGTKGVGVNRQGAFAEYLCIPAFNVVALPDNVSLDVAALLDPFGNAVHTAEQFNLMGQDVLVTGAGPIGIMAAAVARRAGARRVILTDVNDYRLTLAGKLADVRAVNVATEDLRDVMHHEGIENGFDVALEMSGAAPALLQAVDTLAMGGNLALLGIPDGAMQFDWGSIILKAITVRGVYGREMFGTWRRMLGLLEGGLDLDPIITHRLPHDRFQDGFDAMRSGQSGKVVLSW
ncbi:L-threonine 3-dehydrogenase [Sphingomonas sp. 28-63-12]|uniref:L-threonine 3-dehydrogenase n=1 Tax=Sphingomonas sp. 28-63-12 TaxID=1970434 RepID=UPI000BC7B7DA|nr:MAG: L-threonine 3-dehydrogenase [Sphingomonas sp. 28-63-12]